MRPDSAEAIACNLLPSISVDLRDIRCFYPVAVFTGSDTPPFSSNEVESASCNFIVKNVFVCPVEMVKRY